MVWGISQGHKCRTVHIATGVNLLGVVNPAILHQRVFDPRLHLTAAAAVQPSPDVFNPIGDPDRISFDFGVKGDGGLDENVARLAGEAFIHV